MSKSFRITHFPVPESVFLKIDAQLSVLKQKEREFVLHVLASNVARLNRIHRQGLTGWEDIAVELPSAFIINNFGGRIRPAEINRALLSFRNHSTEHHKCRTFTAGNVLLDALWDWKPPVGGENTVNVFDGTPYQVQVPDEWVNGTYSSKLIRDAIRVFDQCPFSYEKLSAHLSAAESRLSSVVGVERRRALGAFRNDVACAARVCAGCTLTGDGMAAYVPEFRTIYTGRISEVGGGSQSCSRAMKSAMFDGVPDLRNYDLKRAQAFILLQELEDAGLSHVWLSQYLDSADANQTYATQIGVSKDTFKACLYATIMGARHVKHWYKKHNEIYRLLIDDCGFDAQAQQLALAVFGLLAPLKSEVDAWHRHLLEDPSCLRVDYGRTQVRTLKNACGQHFKLEGYHQDKLARKAAAFILQGQESAFIHRLTALGSAHGFQPVSNQHDGLVVIGAIPQCAVDAAAAASGLRYASMEVKPFE